mmetsp:Transcript_1580/g.4890  ORF Transcript_1580/g.4890 Transcript_1580/m.4890 type:complete len:779 (+) Transcript_1580:3527-5863(+)
MVVQATDVVLALLIAGVQIHGGGLLLGAALGHGRQPIVEHQHLVQMRVDERIHREHVRLLDELDLVGQILQRLGDEHETAAQIARQRAAHQAEAVRRHDRRAQEAQEDEATHGGVLVSGELAGHGVLQVVAHVAKRKRRAVHRTVDARQELLADLAHALQVLGHLLVGLVELALGRLRTDQLARVQLVAHVLLADHAVEHRAQRRLQVVAAHELAKGRQQLGDHAVAPEEGVGRIGLAHLGIDRALEQLHHLIVRLEQAHQDLREFVGLRDLHRVAQGQHQRQARLAQHVQQLVVLVLALAGVFELGTLLQDVGEHLEESGTRLGVVVVAHVHKVLEAVLNVGAHQVAEALHGHLGNLGQHTGRRLLAASQQTGEEGEVLRELLALGFVIVAGQCETDQQRARGTQAVQIEVLALALHLRRVRRLGAVSLGELGGPLHHVLDDRVAERKLIANVQVLTSVHHRLQQTAEARLAVERAQRRHQLAHKLEQVQQQLLKVGEHGVVVGRARLQLEDQLHDRDRLIDEQCALCGELNLTGGTEKAAHVPVQLSEERRVGGRGERAADQHLDRLAHRHHVADHQVEEVRHERLENRHLALLGHLAFDHHLFGGLLVDGDAAERAQKAAAVGPLLYHLRLVLAACGRRRHHRALTLVGARRRGNLGAALLFAAGQQILGDGVPALAHLQPTAVGTGGLAIHTTKDGADRLLLRLATGGGDRRHRELAIHLQVAHDRVGVVLGKTLQVQIDDLHLLHQQAEDARACGAHLHLAAVQVNQQRTLEL